MVIDKLPTCKSVYEQNKKLMATVDRLRVHVGRVWLVLRRHGPLAIFEYFGGTYQRWILLYDRLSRAERRQCIEHQNSLPYRPTVAILIDATADKHDLLMLKSTFESIREQIYNNVHVFVLVNKSGETALLRDEIRRFGFQVVEHGSDNAATDLCRQGKWQTCEYQILLKSGDRLSPDALYLAALALNARADLAWIYSDQDFIEGNVRCNPVFFPDWNEDLFFAQGVVPAFNLVRRTVCERVADRVTMFDFAALLKLVTEVPQQKFEHIPHVLYHQWTRGPLQKSVQQVESERALLREHYRKRQLEVVVQAAPEPQFHRVVHSLPDPAPTVSLIIPTRDRVELLERCLNSILHGTSYPNLQIIIVDNDSTEESTKQYLSEVSRHPAVKVISYPGEFNFSAMNNAAIKQADGSVIALLNNDCEALGQDWLTEMVSQCLRKGVGAVGAKLYFPDKTIQHAGICLSSKFIALHYYWGLPWGSSGYQGRLNLVQAVSGVTAACLVMRKEVFDALGGFDESLPSSFNDVDLCLRITERGYEIIYTPHAELVHLESATRGGELNKDALNLDVIVATNRIREKHGTRLTYDPYWNPNLPLRFNAKYMLSFPPRKSKPYISPAVAVRSTY